ncbi:MAG: cytidine deaminase [Ilumatobacter sp.]
MTTSPARLSIDELVDLAVDAAIDARTRAYAPYSKFTMGASIVATDGRVVRGAIVENVSLGLAICSERVALFTAVTERVDPAVLAVCSRRTRNAFTFPCGACLQVALEIGGPELVVVAVDDEGATERAVLADLLPRGPKFKTPDLGGGAA